MLTIEERVAVVGARLRRLSYAQVQEEFRRKFHKPAPTRANIRLLVNKFQRTGNVSDAPRSVPEETVARIREAIERSPQASTRRLSNELDVPRATVLKILRFTLKKRAYHIQVLHKLDEEDYAVCYDLMEAVNNENLFEHILFSDDATFQTCGKVN